MSYAVFVMRGGFPGAVVRLLVILLFLFTVGLVVWFAYFASRPSVAPERVGGVTAALFLTAMLSGGCSLASGLLTFHYRREAYGAGEAVIFGSMFIVSTGILVCSGMWGLAALVFG